MYACMYSTYIRCLVLVMMVVLEMPQLLQEGAVPCR